MSTNLMNPRIAGAITAGLAVVVAGMGLVGAQAYDSSPGSFETAPSITCPGTDEVALVHAAGDQLDFLNANLTPTQVVNSWVLRTAGNWTTTHFNPLGTTEREVANSKTPTSEVDVRDMGMRRIAVFVVTQTGEGWAVTRSYQCATPKIA
jgi:hypothetical protein